MNNAITILTEAVNLRKPVEFEYLKEGKPPGKRIGNPHILFSGSTKDGTKKAWSHIVQTGGVSETLDVFPDWRMFIIADISNIKILHDHSSFGIFEGYDPDSDIYSKTQILAKV